MQSFGIINIDGRNYLKQPQWFPFQKAVTVNLETDTTQRLILPGSYPFMLQYLTREVLDAAGAPATRRFLYRFGNSDGNVWYAQGGVGGTSDRVMDNLIFGNAQFPGALPVPIIYQPNASIQMEFQDVSNNAPYVIHLGFWGVYLKPLS